MQGLRILLAAIAGLVWSISAQADVYTWVPETAAGYSGFSPVGLFPLGQIAFETESAGSHFSFVGSCSFPTPCAPEYSTGDFGSFSIQTSIPGHMQPIASVDINVTFNADGTLSGIVDYTDDGADYLLNGSGDNWSGQFNSDLLNCHDPNPCQATGYWATSENVLVPEPSTWSIAFAGLALAAVSVGMKKRPAARATRLVAKAAWRRLKEQ